MSERNWISVKDQLPDHFEKVIGAYKNRLNTTSARDGMSASKIGRRIRLLLSARILYPIGCHYLNCQRRRTTMRKMKGWENLDAWMKEQEAINRELYRRLAALEECIEYQDGNEPIEEEKDDA